MDSTVVLIGAAVGLIVIAAYFFTRIVRRRSDLARKDHAPAASSVEPLAARRFPQAPPRGRGAGQAGRSARCEAERQKMRPLTNYNEEVIDRLVTFERNRMPHASEEALHSAAHERLVRDNR